MGRRSLAALGQRFVWQFAWVLGAVLCLGFFRLRARGRERLPAEGPYLLLPNHTSLFDTLWTAWPVRRQVRFVGSARLFRVPGIAPLLRAVGVLPRNKYVTDGGSVLSIRRSLGEGHVVLMFPEGSRTWDGRTQPVLPGLGRLIRAMKVPVVFARVTTGHHVQPRWATYPRWVPVHVEYDGPHDLGDLDPVAIEAEADRRITVDPEAPPPSGSFGWRMAHGLPAFLWACPHCFTLGGIVLHPESGDAVCCGACGASWDVDVAQRLVPRPDSRAPAAATTVPHAYDRLREHFAGEDGRPVSDPEALRSRGTYLEGDGAVVAVADDGQCTELARGRVVLGAHHLEVRADVAVAWSVALTDISGRSLELGSLLQFRVAGELYQLRVEQPSTVAWDHFLGGGQGDGVDALDPGRRA